MLSLLKRHIHTKASTVKDNEDDYGTGVVVIQGEAKRAVGIQPGEDKVQRGILSCT